MLSYYFGTLAQMFTTLLFSLEEKYLKMRLDSCEKIKSLISGICRVHDTFNNFSLVGQSDNLCFRLQYSKLPPTFPHISELSSAPHLPPFPPYTPTLFLVQAPIPPPPPRPHPHLRLFPSMVLTPPPPPISRPTSPPLSSIQAPIPPPQPSKTPPH